jgi:hypothetical protein
MKATLTILLAVLAGACGSSPTTPSSTPTAAPVARWALSGVVTSSAGGPVNGAVVAILDGPNANRTTNSDGTGRYSLSDLTQAGFTLRITARGYTDATMPVTLTANQVVDVRLLLPLARLLDIGGSPVRYDRVPGGFEAYASGINDASGCAAQVSGVTTFTNASTRLPTLTFAWTLPPERIIRPGETFEYHIGFMSDPLAFAFPEGTASTRFSGISVPCP